MMATILFLDELSVRDLNFLICELDFWSECDPNQSFDLMLVFDGFELYCIRIKNRHICKGSALSWS